MTDRAVIFSGPMVRALLENRKSMTRRLAWSPCRRCQGGGKRFYAYRDGPQVACGACKGSEQQPSPWQRVRTGDRLWVREAWKVHSTFEGTKPRDIPPSTVFYLADQRYSPSGSKGRPSIFMPRWASRLTLTLTAAKIERLHDISEADAQAEGVDREPGLDGRWRDYGVEHVNIRWSATPRDSFATLWNSLHGAGAWESNPDVVALSFTVEQRNIDREAA